MRGWALGMGVSDLTAEAIDKVIEADGERIWNEQWLERKEAVEAVLQRHSSSVPYSARLQYRGSLLRGRRGSHKGRIRFNPDSFDVDAYVVSPELHAEAVGADSITRFGRVSAAISAKSSNLSSMRGLVSRIASDMSRIEGCQPEKFDIFIRRNEPD